MAFTLVTYNVLATAYIKPEWYSRVEPELLDPARRIPAILSRISTLGAELLCLQEVEGIVFDRANTLLASAGFAGQFLPKGHGRPDGCATFFRTDRFSLRHTHRLEYDDRGPADQKTSGHVALLNFLEHEGHLLGIANTHVRWDPPGTPDSSRVSLRQVNELLSVCRELEPRCRSWVICGDFNCLLDSAPIAAVQAAGYRIAHGSQSGARSCVANGRASLIDHIAHSPGLRCDAQPPPPLADDSALPSEDEPSDHVPLTALFEWEPETRPG